MIALDVCRRAEEERMRMVEEVTKAKLEASAGDTGVWARVCAPVHCVCVHAYLPWDT